jgi:hypothetical protein
MPRSGKFSRKIVAGGVSALRRYLDAILLEVAADVDLLGLSRTRPAMFAERVVPPASDPGGTAGPQHPDAAQRLEGRADVVSQAVGDLVVVSATAGRPVSRSSWKGNTKRNQNRMKSPARL